MAIWFSVDRSSRIVVNTIASYARLGVAALSGFLTLPIVLRMLGATDFGIFSVIVASLNVLLFVNGALTGGAQRHIAYALGTDSKEEARRWFGASVMVHAVLAVAVLISALACSHWILNRLLSLPADRIGAAQWIYRAVILVLCCSILSTPYQAMINAKEAMAVLSLISMSSSLALVAGVYGLTFQTGDHLLWYSGVYAVSDGLVLVGPVLYCVARYSECRRLSLAAIRWDTIKELLVFSSWNVLGTLAVQIRYQGPAILFNRFVGTTANAANGIAMQVNGFTANVSTALLAATTPPIVKAEASGNRREALFISNLTNKYAFLLLWLLVGPLLFSLNYCLTLWLHQIPADTVAFSVALLVALLVDMLTAGFIAAVQAEGRIGTYQCVIGILLCISVPIGYLLLRMHLPHSSVLWATVVGSAAAGAGRLSFLCGRLDLKASDWLRHVLLPCAITALVCSLGMIEVVFLIPSGFPRLLSLYVLNSTAALFLAWIFARSEQEKRVAKNYFVRFEQHLSSETRKVLALTTRRA